MTDPCPDPDAALLDGLADAVIDAVVDGAPLLAWAVRAAAHPSGDAVAAAWRGCVRNDAAMRRLLAACGWVAGAWGGYDGGLYCTPYCERSRCARCCDAIRAVLPIVRFADVVVAAAARARGAVA